MRIWSGLTAVAAAVAIVVLWPADPAPLPAYTLAISVGEQPLRSPDPDAPVALGPGSAVTVVLRPERQVRRAVAVRAWLESEAGRRPWEPEVTTSPSGSVRVVVEADALPVSAGHWSLVFAVGPARLASAALNHPGWQVQRVPIELRR